MHESDNDDWDSHWERYADAIERNPAQRYRRKQILLHLFRGNQEVKPVRIVDIGAGQGDLLRSLQKELPGSEFLALEPSAVGIAQIRRKVPGAAVEQIDLLKSESPSERWIGWASHAICSEVLEHVDDPVALLRSARCMLAPGCVLVVTVPSGPMSAFDRHIGHRKHYSKNELLSVLESAGFVEVNVKAAGFPIFNLYKLVVILRGRRLIQDVDGSANPKESSVARFVMSVFKLMFGVALPDSRWGWQLVATAYEPDAKK